ncbi:ferlin family protein, partial [Cystoisospora suis]
MVIPYNDPDVANLKIEEPDDYVSFREAPARRFSNDLASRLEKKKSREGGAPAGAGAGPAPPGENGAP